MSSQYDSLWSWCHNNYGDNCSFVLFTFGTQILHFITFWLHCLLLLPLDLYPEHFTSMRLWKIQKVKLEKEKIFKAIKVALYNQFFVNIPFAIVVYVLFKSRLKYSVDDFPTFGIIIRDMIMFVLVEEIGFFYGHMLMHSSYFYARFHKMHHEFTAPICCACIYAHPLEHVLCNLSPLVAGPLIMKSHIIVYWLWLTIAVFSTIVSHSGYHFMFLPSSEKHDFHHLKFNTNYGVLGVLDWLHGTDEIFQNTSELAR